MSQQITLKVIPENPASFLDQFTSEEGRQLIQSYLEFYPQIGFHLPWVGYFILINDQLVGSCGFVGKPANGVVELAYWTFKEYEGKGIASQACAQLIQIAREVDSTVSLMAKTSPEKNASTTILEKNGFRFSKIVQDHEIGDAWLWELTG